MTASRAADALQAAGPRPLAVRPAQAGKLVGLSERTIRELVATGELKSVRVGSARLIPWAALEAWLSER